MLIDFRTTGPKRWCNRRLGPGIITTPPQHNTTNTSATETTTAGTPSHQHKRRLAGGDEGLRPACLNPLTVCVFFRFSLTILIFIYTYSYNYGTSTSTSTGTSTNSLREKAHTTRDASFGPYMSFFLIFVFFLYAKRCLQVLSRLQR